MNNTKEERREKRRFHKLMLKRNAEKVCPTCHKRYIFSEGCKNTAEIRNGGEIPCELLVYLRTHKIGYNWYGGGRVLVLDASKNYVKKIIAKFGFENIVSRSVIYADLL